MSRDTARVRAAVEERSRAQGFLFGAVSPGESVVGDAKDAVGGVVGEARGWASGFGALFTWNGGDDGPDILDSQFERGEGGLFSSDPWSRK